MELIEVNNASPKRATGIYVLLLISSGKKILSTACNLLMCIAHEASKKLYSSPTKICYFPRTFLRGIWYATLAFGRGRQREGPRPHHLSTRPRAEDAAALMCPS